MPADYEAIKRRMRAKNPRMSEAELKTRSAKITNAARQEQGRPPARFHKAKSKRKSMLNGGY